MTSPLTDFRLFEGERVWVLRDTSAHYDYPFTSEAAAVKAIHSMVVDNVSYVGSPAEHNAYGAPPAFEAEASA